MKPGMTCAIPWRFRRAPSATAHEPRDQRSLANGNDTGGNQQLERQPEDDRNQGKADQGAEHREEGQEASKGHGVRLFIADGWRCVCLGPNATQ